MKIHIHVGMAIPMHAIFWGWFTNQEWLGALLKEKGQDLFRTKGVLAVQGMKQRFVFQAVHMACNSAPQKDWEADEERICKLTFIGKNLNRKELEDGFKKCLVNGGYTVN